MDVFEKVKSTLTSILGLEEKNIILERDTQLLGGIPEFDSMAIVGILNTLEEQLDIFFEEEDITAEIFETVGSFVGFLEKKV